MDKEEFYRVKIGDMYIKDFKLNAVKDSNNHWRVDKLITLTNNKGDGIPILKEEAQSLMVLLDKSAVLDSFKEKEGE